MKIEITWPRQDKTILHKQGEKKSRETLQKYLKDTINMCHAWMRRPSCLSTVLCLLCFLSVLLLYFSHSILSSI